MIDLLAGAAIGPALYLATGWVMLHAMGKQNALVLQVYGREEGALLLFLTMLLWPVVLLVILTEHLRDRWPDE